MDSTQQAPRVPINFRISQDRLDAYQVIAETYRLDRATVIRAHLAVAERHKDEVRQILNDIEKAL